MSKIAVLMAEGYEEGETLTIVDILRRAGLTCDTFFFGNKLVKGMHGIYVEGDKPFGEEVKAYDMVVLPGGRPGGQNLKENPEVIAMVQDFNRNNKYIAAMCSGTVVLSDAKVIEGKEVTGYVGYAEKLIGGIFKDQVVVADQNLVTSQGPATPYPFAYKIAEIFGKDTSTLREKMLYHLAGGK
ncbi:DJ-1 family protein [Paenibacillus sp. FSL R7-269]|uniref:DJ-1 family glyoxalase III n=1 Tax=Paenibacillus sp. FSL R7-269 TaxID=1226755 RepID=UPI0003E218A2|nr:DJ-1 family glyoxalase III [Paenibacillus sp. FSL R7-269]ETT56205.1 DJ-1 family protein [Paenibacillus sp. FSL R7-269]